MQGLLIVLIIAASVGAIAILISAFRQKKPLRSLFASSLSGIALLFIISLTSGLTGISLAINAWTISCVAITGIPGVIMLLLIRFIWNL